MHIPGTSKWSTAVRRAVLLAGLAVVLVVALPVTASGSPAGKSGPTVAKAPCGEDVLIKSFTPKQGETDRWVVIKGKHLDFVQDVLVFYGEGFDTVDFWILDNEHIGFYIPYWAETGPLGILGNCSDSFSQKKLVIH